MQELKHRIRHGMPPFRLTLPSISRIIIMKRFQRTHDKTIVARILALSRLLANMDG
jgi:hypothetical protein